MYSDIFAQCSVHQQEFGSKCSALAVLPNSGIVTHDGNSVFPEASESRTSPKFDEDEEVSGEKMHVRGERQDFKKRKKNLWDVFLITCS